jgi:hypothetical protein
MRFVALALGVSLTATTPAVAIGTLPEWDGQQYEFPFGCPETNTYGQVITIPREKHFLTGFSLRWANYSATTSMVVRGELYAWDGTKASGPALWESQPQSISYVDNRFHRITFRSGAVAVTPGAQYLIFASVDKDYNQCIGESQLKWGAVPDSIYAHGMFVYQDGSDPNLWTTERWLTDNLDLALRVFLSP